MIFVTVISHQFEDGCAPLPPAAVALHQTSYLPPCRFSKNSLICLSVTDSISSPACHASTIQQCWPPPLREGGLPAEDSLDAGAVKLQETCFMRSSRHAGSSNLSSAPFLTEQIGKTARCTVHHPVPHCNFRQAGSSICRFAVVDEKRFQYMLEGADRVWVANRDLSRPPP